MVKRYNIKEISPNPPYHVSVICSARASLWRDSFLKRVSGPSSPRMRQSIVGVTTGFANSVKNDKVLTGFSLRFWPGVKIQESKPRTPISGLQSQESKPRNPSPGLQTQDSKPRKPSPGIQAQDSKHRKSNPRNELYGKGLEKHCKSY